MLIGGYVTHSHQLPKTEASASIANIVKTQFDPCHNGSIGQCLGKDLPGMGISLSEKLTPMGMLVDFAGTPSRDEIVSRVVDMPWNLFDYRPVPRY
jgi:hypothetical protein